MREGRKNGYEQREADRRVRRDIERQNMTRKERKKQKARKEAAQGKARKKQRVR